MTDLKPCPFCGNKEIIDDEDDGITCPNCGTYIDRLSVEDDVCMADIWNTRQIEDKKDKEVKRLREALELIAKTKFYFARGEEEKQIRRVCEIAEEALKGGEE